MQKKQKVDAFDLIFGDRIETLLRLADEHRESSISHDDKQFIEYDDVALLIRDGADFKYPYQQPSGYWLLELTHRGRTFVYAGAREPEIPLHLVH